MVSSMRPMKRLAYGGAALVPAAVPTSWRKCLSMNERLFFLRIVSSKTPMVWELGVPGGRRHRHAISCSAVQTLNPLRELHLCNLM